MKLAIDGEKRKSKMPSPIKTKARITMQATFRAITFTIVEYPCRLSEWKWENQNPDEFVLVKKAENLGTGKLIPDDRFIFKGLKAGIFQIELGSYEFGVKKSTRIFTIAVQR